MKCLKVALTLITFFIGVFCIPVTTLAQDGDLILVRNGSFEDIPKRGVSGPFQTTSIKDWIDCGDIGQSPPDIHPDTFWQVDNLPFHGNTYLGMVTREDETWERVGQRLSEPLEGGSCYQFNLHMARSDKYLSATSVNPNTKVNFTRPVVLRIWGGSSVCRKGELLAESEPVTNFEWKNFYFTFKPIYNHRYIILEAYYKTPVLFPYNGHILIDNASMIQSLPCEVEIASLPPKYEYSVENPIAQITPPRKNINSSPKGSTTAKSNPSIPDNPVIPDPVNPSHKEDKIIEDLKRENIYAGRTFVVNRLHFEADTFNIGAQSYPVLNEIFEFMTENPDVIIEIGGHTNTIPPSTYCDKLSTQRAKEVVNHLVAKGISPNRLKYKGYGKNKPIVRNDRYDKKAREKNQRVEIKILSYRN